MLAEPTSCLVKFTLEGEMATTGAVATPSNGMDCGLPAALSETKMDAERFPAAVGLKATLT